MCDLYTDISKVKVSSFLYSLSQSCLSACGWVLWLATCSVCCGSSWAAKGLVLLVLLLIGISRQLRSGGEPPVGRGDGSDNARLVACSVLFKCVTGN